MGQYTLPAYQFKAEKVAAQPAIHRDQAQPKKFSFSHRSQNSASQASTPVAESDRAALWEVLMHPA